MLVFGDFVVKQNYKKNPAYPFTIMAHIVEK